MCQNTYDIATRMGDLRWSIKHTSSAKDRLIEARLVLSVRIRVMDDMDREIIEFMDRDFRDSQWVELVNNSASGLPH